MEDGREPAALIGAGIPNGRCTWDGIPLDCAGTSHLMERGLVAAAPVETVRVRDGRLETFTAVLGPGGRIHSSYVPAGTRFEEFYFNSGLTTVLGIPPDRDDWPDTQAFSLLRNYWADLPFGFAQNTDGWKKLHDSLKEMNEKNDKSKKLSDCVKNFLAQFFDKALLDKVRVSEGYVPPGNDAITFNNHVTFRKGRLDQRTFGGILLIAHEIRHSAQYAALGTEVFLTLYRLETARLLSDPAV